jgi:hypothetical protein
MVADVFQSQEQVHPTQAALRYQVRSGKGKKE